MLKEYYPKYFVHIWAFIVISNIWNNLYIFNHLFKTKRKYLFMSCDIKKKIFYWMIFYLMISFISLCENNRSIFFTGFIVAYLLFFNVTTFTLMLLILCEMYKIFSSSSITVKQISGLFSSNFCGVISVKS